MATADPFTTPERTATKAVVIQCPYEVAVENVMPFQDRRDAGRSLAIAVAQCVLDSPVVLALPRGGVPVGFEVASVLDAQLEVFVARKVGAPGQPELGIGAVAEGGAAVFDALAGHAVGVPRSEFDRLAAAERRELERRVRRYRSGRALPPVEGRDVVLVDDGLATGVTAEAALLALQARHPRRLVLAVPVCAAQSAQRLSRVADEVVCVRQPDPFIAVGLHYESFRPTIDEEVVHLLERATARVRETS